MRSGYAAATVAASSRAGLFTRRREEGNLHAVALFACSCRSAF
jgi:hypothetical protein